MCIRDRDMIEILGYEKSPDKFDDVNIVSEDIDKTIKLEWKYLEVAKVHFTTYEFNLAYIELIIALETALKTYLRRRYIALSKTKDKTLNLGSMTKNLSLIDLVKFVVERPELLVTVMLCHMLRDDVHLPPFKGVYYPKDPVCRPYPEFWWIKTF